MTIHSLNLATKNNKERGSYFYFPIVKIDENYFYCKPIKTNKPIKPKDVDLSTIEIIRQVPKEFYKANNII